MFDGVDTCDLWYLEIEMIIRNENCTPDDLCVWSQQA